METKHAQEQMSVGSDRVISRGLPQFDDIHEMKSRIPNDITMMRYRTSSSFACNCTALRFISSAEK